MCSGGFSACASTPVSVIWFVTLFRAVYGSLQGGVGGAQSNYLGYGGMSQQTAGCTLHQTCADLSRSHLPGRMTNTRGRKCAKKLKRNREKKEKNVLLSSESTSPCPAAICTQLASSAKRKSPRLFFPLCRPFAGQRCSLIFTIHLSLSFRI